MDMVINIFKYIYRAWVRHLFQNSILFIGLIAAALVRIVYLRGIYHDFRGASVFLIGAAPSARDNKFDYDKYAAISSASETLVKGFGRPCDLSIMDGSFFNIEFSRSCPSKSAMHEKNAFANDVENLVVVSSNRIKPNVNFSSIIKNKQNFHVPVWVRAFIVNYVCGTNYLDNFGAYRYTQTGSGAWSLALLVFLKVRSVYITGINLRTGTDGKFSRYHHGGVAAANNVEYLQSRCRNHSSPDINVFSSIALRYRGKVDLTTNEPDIECAISPNLT